MYSPVTPPVTPPDCNLTCVRNFFLPLSEKWRSLGLVQRSQAKQMISKSDTLRMVGNEYFTELYTCMIPKKQHKRNKQKRNDKRRLLHAH